MRSVLRRRRLDAIFRGDPQGRRPHHRTPAPRMSPPIGSAPIATYLRYVEALVVIELLRLRVFMPCAVGRWGPGRLHARKVLRRAR